uniref:Uncharacterized protein n=1 Tax=Cuerna arida TaxID=1464854 RepID=A0A1B6GW33_9HEMI
MGSEIDPYYDGSRMFSWITELSGIPIDLINFTVTQVVAVVLAPLFRGILHPSRTTPEVRHGFCLVVGVVMGYFAFGRQVVHLAGLPTLCYLVICTQNPQTMQRLVLVISMFYLSCIHIHRQMYDYGSLSLDVTGPLMVIVQKVTSLACSLNDGLTYKKEDLSANQRYYAVSKIPSVLEYFAYIFQFHVLMAGPLVFYKDYIEFVNGHNILKHSSGIDNHIDSNLRSSRLMLEPSPKLVVIKKIASSVLFAFIFVSFISSFPISKIKDDDFVEKRTMFSQLCYLSIATLLVRFKFYHAWLLADAICNLSGLGFQGYAPDGSSRWDLVSNVDVIQFEFGSSLRESIEHWNKGTNVWLRMLVYDRYKRYPTVLTYAVSSFWHGFYPGYYLTFAGGALFTFASRSVRHSIIRDFFQGTPTLRSLYNILSMVTTRIIVTYITFSFVLLEFWPSIRIYNMKTKQRWRRTWAEAGATQWRC